MLVDKTVRETVFDKVIVNLRDFRHLKLSRSSLAIACLILEHWDGFHLLRVFCRCTIEVKGTLVRELDRRVEERTAALGREMAEHRRLDQEIARVADRERRRLGTICTIAWDSISLAPLSQLRC